MATASPRRLRDGLHTCPGPRVCVSCPWSTRKNGPCAECTPKYWSRCLKRTCYLNCRRCSGGKLARTIGCCGHAPAKWRDSWHDLLRAPLTFRAYRPKPLDIKFPLIPVIHRIADRCIPQLPEFDEIDTWAVPVSKVASVRGRFHSEDLKDYLGIPSTKKLLLSTCASDRYQEMLWRRGRLMDYEKHGIDYWFPAHFSIYDGDSKMYQLASARRQQRNAASDCG